MKNIILAAFLLSGSALFAQKADTTQRTGKDTVVKDVRFLGRRTTTTTITEIRTGRRKKKRVQQDTIKGAEQYIKPADTTHGHDTLLKQ